MVGTQEVHRMRGCYRRKDDLLSLPFPYGPDRLAPDEAIRVHPCENAGEAAQASANGGGCQGDGKTL